MIPVNANGILAVIDSFNQQRRHGGAQLGPQSPCTCHNADFSTQQAWVRTAANAVQDAFWDVEAKKDDLRLTIYDNNPTLAKDCQDSVISFLSQHPDGVAGTCGACNLPRHFFWVETRTYSVQNSGPSVDIDILVLSNGTGATTGSLGLYFGTVNCNAALQPRLPTTDPVPVEASEPAEEEQKHQKRSDFHSPLPTFLTKYYLASQHPDQGQYKRKLASIDRSQVVLFTEFGQALGNIRERKISVGLSQREAYQLLERVANARRSTVIEAVLAAAQLPQVARALQLEPLQQGEFIQVKVGFESREINNELLYCFTPVSSQSEPVGYYVIYSGSKTRPDSEFDLLIEEVHFDSFRVTRGILNKSPETSEDKEMENQCEAKTERMTTWILESRIPNLEAKNSKRVDEPMGTSMPLETGTFTQATVDSTHLSSGTDSGMPESQLDATEPRFMGN